MLSICRITAVAFIISVYLITGGVNTAHSKNNRYIFDLVVKNNKSAVTTTMRVYAKNAREAREEVAGNGWTVLTLTQVTFNESDEILLTPYDDSVSKTGFKNKDDFVDKVTGKAVPSATVKNNDVDKGSVLPGIPADNITNDYYEGVMPIVEEKDNDSILVLTPPEPVSDKASTVDNVSSSPEDKVSIIPEIGVVITPMDNLTGVAVIEKTPDNKQEPHINNESKPSMDISGKSNEEVKAMLKDATLIGIVYFDIGNVSPILNSRDNFTKLELPDNMFYYVLGYTDNVRVIRNPEYVDNKDLSIKRALFIKELMQKKGLQPEKIYTAGFGDSQPVVPNIKGGTPLNRRVEVYGLR